MDSYDIVSMTLYTTCGRINSSIFMPNHNGAINAAHCFCGFIAADAIRPVDSNTFTAHVDQKCKVGLMMSLIQGPTPTEGCGL